MRHHQALFCGFAFVALGASLLAPARAAGQETPRRGGVLLAAIAADAPSLDPHQEQTFATIQLVAPLYSTLIQIDPLQLPEDHRRRGHRVEDRARRAHVHVQDPAGDPLPRRLAADGRRRQGHLRQDHLPARGRAEHPQEHLHRGGRASRRPTRAPWCSSSSSRRRRSWPTWPRRGTSSIPKKYLDKDPNHFKTNVVGSGPFKFKSYTRGSTFEGERNPDYFIKDRPYLDGYKFFISTETSVRAAAIRSGRAYIEFRTLPAGGGGGDQEAARRQGRRAGDARHRAVRHRDQPDGEALHRRPRPQGPHAGHRSLHGGPGAVSDREL